MIDKLFMLCVYFLEWLGKMTGLNYKKISVVFNIYIQGGILLVSSCLPLIKVILCNSDNGGKWRILFFGGCLIYIGLYVYGLYRLCKRYSTPLEDAFDICVDDLLFLSKKWGMSYNAVNILIFVIGWFLCVGLNCALLFLNYRLLYYYEYDNSR